MIKRFRKVVSVALCACMVAVFQVPTMALAYEGDAGDAGLEAGTENAPDYSGALETVVPADCLSQSVAELYGNGKVKCDNEGVSIVVDEGSSSIVVSGKRSAVLGSTLVVDKSFDFGTTSIGRFSVSGLSAKGKRVVLGFYLDNQVEPFFTTRLKVQRYGSWIYPDIITENVLARGIKGTHKLSIKVEDCSADPSFSLNSFEFSQSSVPIFNINIDEELGTVDAMDSSERHTAYCYGSVSIDVPAGCTSSMTGEALSGTAGELELEYIRGRGNSTWETAKKPYKFKLDKAENLLGMGKNKHWALMANAYDMGQLRNIMTSRLGMAMGMEFTPSMEPVEVVMNGKYLGCYMLAEVTRVDETRVDIDEEEDYLLSLGNWSLDEDKLHFMTKQAAGVFQIESPDTYSDTDNARYDYISNYVQQVEDAIYAGDSAEIWRLMDLEHAVKYYWFEEFSKNGDGFTSGSCYLYKRKDGKLCWGPLWDFDYAWKADLDSSGFMHNDNFWNKQLFFDQTFVDALNEVWPEFRACLVKLVEAGGTIDQLWENANVAVAYDLESWRGGADNSGAHIGITGDEAYGLAKADMEELRSWINDRISWFDENLEATTVIEPTTVTFMVDDKVLEVRELHVGEMLDTMPTAPSKAGYEFDSWEYQAYWTLADELAEYNMTEDEYRTFLMEDCEYSKEAADALIDELKAGTFRTKMAYADTLAEKDMIVSATYVEAGEAASVSKIFTTQETVFGYYDDAEQMLVTIPFETEPFDHSGNEIEFISSDTSVVDSSNWEGQMVVKGPGDATVTMRSQEGVTATVKVHIYTKDEYKEAAYLEPEPYFDFSVFEIEAGSYAMLPLSGIPEGAVINDYPSIKSNNNDVVSVGECSVIHAVSSGLAVVTVKTNDYDTSMCIVKVVDPEGSSPHVGSVVTRGALKYQVTSVGKTRTVACVGAKKTSVTAVSVPAAVTIEGKSYKVTEIANGAFANCKKLKTATLGKNLQIVGANAFKGCSKLVKVTFKSAQKPKVYSSAFKSVNKKLKFYVPKSQKAYYKLILGKKRVK